MSLYWKPFVFIIMLGAAAGAVAAPWKAVPEDDGSFRIGEQQFRLCHYNPRWQGSEQSARTISATFRQKTAERFQLEAQWKLADGKTVPLREEIRQEPGGTFHYRASISVPEPVPTATLILTTHFPCDTPNLAIHVDGKTISLPAKYQRLSLFGGPARRLELFWEGGSCRFDGDFQVIVQDNRRYKSNGFSVRIFRDPLNTPVKTWELSFRGTPDHPITPAELKTFPVRLTVANRAFRDEQPGDGKGGWTDQGPENDLRAFELAPRKFRNVAFDIPASGNGCLVLSGRRPDSLREAELPVSVPPEYARNLYLLHAAAWTGTTSDKTVATIRIGYADGSTQELKVVDGRDVGNWWGPLPLQNAAVAWETDNARTKVGLYLSCFRLDRPDPVKLTFLNSSGQVWLLAGISFGNGGLRLAPGPEDKVTLRAGKEYLPLAPFERIAAGSPLDLSSTLEAPAGKFGRVICTPSGAFGFEKRPGKTIRFLGINLVKHCNYLDKAEVDRLVDYLAVNGYNSVRFHHFENGLLDPKAENSTTFDPARLDQLDYLFARLKERGIYCCLDLYASRAIRPGDKVEEIPAFRGYELKMLLSISPSAMRTWKAFVRQLLTHRNPYTGLTWGEDPALYSFNLINEQTLVVEWNRLYPELAPLFEKRYVQYLKERGLDTPERIKARNGEFIRFLNELEGARMDEQIRFLREELGVRTLITDHNYVNKFTMQPLRERLDFVDNHQYWDHPEFVEQRWRLPNRYHQRSALARMAEFPRAMMPTRIFGKPFTVTEYNYCNPNRFRREAGPLAGAWAGFQEWNGLYRFAWSHARPQPAGKGRAPAGFDIANDPQELLSERIVHALFVRGDVAPGREAIAFTVDDALISKLPNLDRGTTDYPTDFNRLGLFHRIGTLTAGKQVPGVQALPVGDWYRGLSQTERAEIRQAADEKRAVTDTGEIEIDGKSGHFRCLTPRSEVLVLPGGDAAGRLLRVSGATVAQTVALISKEKQPITAGGDLLLFQLTRTGNTGMRFRDRKERILESWGTLPVLLQRGSAQIEIGTLPPGAWHVVALSPDGTERGTVPSEFTGGKLRFTAANDAFPQGVMAYFITRKQPNNVVPQKQEQ